MKPVVIGPEAGEEIREAIDYLNLHRTGTGDDFEADVEAALDMIGKQPKAFAPHRVRFRKYVVKRFGYLIFYAEHNRSQQIA
jgi:plasmid stabilization system protein ParE